MKCLACPMKLGVLMAVPMNVASYLLGCDTVTLWQKNSFAVTKFNFKNYISEVCWR
jgi:hypothetical protein